MKRVISILVSLTILLIIYLQIDFGRLIDAFVGADLLALVAGLAMVVPTTLATAWRFSRLAPRDADIGLGEATRLTLAASSLNMILPSKLGDLAKAWFIRDRGHISGSLAVALVVFEKASDMLSLLVWCVFGLVLFAGAGAVYWILGAVIAGGLAFGLLMLGSTRFARLFFRSIGAVAPDRIAGRIGAFETDWLAMQAYVWRESGRAWEIAATSVAIWFLHLFQIWLFALAVNADVTLLANLALAPLAILVGLLPLTFAGIGTRDAALIFFFAPYMAAPIAAALGLLCTLRYVMPALAGLPYLSRYVGKVREPRVGADKP